MSFTIQPTVKEFLKLCVQGSQNIVVIGHQDLDKSEVLNELGSFVDAQERLVYVNTPYLASEINPNVKRFQSINEELTRKMVQTALRMDPDRIIVGEIRGEDAYEMIKAMNEGHHGSMASYHCNDSQQFVDQFRETITPSVHKTHPKATASQIENYIYEALNILIFCEEVNGVPHITRIAERVTTSMKSHEFIDICYWERDVAPSFGKLVFTGYVPSFLRDIPLTEEDFLHLFTSNK